MSVQIDEANQYLVWTFDRPITITNTAHVEALQVEDVDTPGSWLDSTFISQDAPYQITTQVTSPPNTPTHWRVNSQPTGISTPITHPQSGDTDWFIAEVTVIFVETVGGLPNALRWFFSRDLGSIDALPTGLLWKGQQPTSAGIDEGSGLLDTFYDAPTAPGDGWSIEGAVTQLTFYHATLYGPKSGLVS